VLGGWWRADRAYLEPSGHRPLDAAVIAAADVGRTLAVDRPRLDPLRRCADASTGRRYESGKRALTALSSWARASLMSASMLDSSDQALAFW